MDSKYRDTGCQTDADKAKEGVLKLPSKHLISKSMNASGDFQHKNEATEKKLSNMSIGDKNKRTSRPTTGKGLSPKPSGTRPDSFKCKYYFSFKKNQGNDQKKLRNYSNTKKIHHVKILAYHAPYFNDSSYQ